MEEERKIFKILICDDDPQDRKLIRAYLRQSRDTDKEIVILEAGPTADIQVALDKGRVDLILMDIQMPEKSGMAWLREIVEKRVAPVVMLTGFGNEEMAVRSLQEGAFGYLPKHKLSTAKLLETIDAAAGKWRESLLGKANQEQLDRLVNIDTLTGLFNRRALLSRFDEQIARAKRYQNELNMLMVDIDNFKKINDHYGHITGDDVLERTAKLLQRGIRETDTVGRYGGDEFMIIIPQTDLPDALAVAERIRNIIKTAEMKDLEGNVFGITVSQGLARHKIGDDRNTFISRADNALYRAKHNGRDRVETSENAHGASPATYALLGRELSLS